jgi:ligand-binding SRPBCC domain-containing protein
MPIIEVLTIIQADKQIVFDLSRSIDLHKISTKHTHEEAVAGRLSGLIELNETVTWKARHFGIYQYLTSRITAFERPDYFVDEMEKGIFKRFRHQHIFKNYEKGTMMIDIFDYESPLGVLGNCADSLFLKAYMRMLLRMRNSTIKDFAETDKWKGILIH